VIDGGIVCNSQGNGKTYCCANVLDKNGYTSTTYCTTCDDTNPPSNCTKREKPMTVVNPGKVLTNILEGGNVLEQQPTDDKLSTNKFKDRLDTQQLEQLQQADDTNMTSAGKDQDGSSGQSIENTD
jgi:hypothetical protein